MLWENRELIMLVKWNARKWLTKKKKNRDHIRTQMTKQINNTLDYISRRMHKMLL